jgi:hypothetical protein
VSEFGDGNSIDDDRRKKLINSARQVMEFLMGEYLDERGKPIFCDKSLPNIVGAKNLLDVFPDAKFICLYRYCMDVVNSLIEALPFGIVGYAVDEYAKNYSQNFVHGFAEYWNVQVCAELEFERSNPGKCLRVRYEDLVVRPEAILREVLTFCNLEYPDEYSEVINFGGTDRFDDSGPGDYKVRFSQRIETSSVGRGRRVPVELIPPPLLEGINTNLSELGYPQVDSDWNHRLGDASRLLDLPISWADYQEQSQLLLSLLNSPRRKTALQAGCEAEGKAVDEVRVALEGLEATLVCGSDADAVITSGYEGPNLISGVDTLLQLCLGSLNVGEALRRGDIRRWGNPPADGATNKEQMGVLDRLAYICSVK